MTDKPVVFLPRKREASPDTYGALTDAGAEVLDVPMVRSEVIGGWDANLTTKVTLVLTSERPLHHLEALGELCASSVVAMTKKIERYALECGFSSTLSFAGVTDARSFAQAIINHLDGVSSPPKFAWLCNEEAAPILSQLLHDEGIGIARINFYRNLGPSPEEVVRLKEAKNAIALALLTSPRVASDFFSALPDYQGVTIAIGPSTAAAIEKMGFQVHSYPDTPSLHAMTTSALSWLRSQR